MEYRKRIDGDTWHWCSNCPDWPHVGCVTRILRPYHGEFCEQCKAKALDGDCGT